MIDTSPNIPVGYSPGAEIPYRPLPVMPRSSGARLFAPVIPYPSTNSPPTFDDPAINGVSWDDVRLAVAVAIPRLEARIAELERERAERDRHAQEG